MNVHKLQQRMKHKSNPYTNLKPTDMEYSISNCTIDCAWRI